MSPLNARAYASCGAIYRTGFDRKLAAHSQKMHKTVALRSVISAVPPSHHIGDTVYTLVPQSDIAAVAAKETRELGNYTRQDQDVIVGDVSALDMLECIIEHFTCMVVDRLHKQPVQRAIISMVTFLVSLKMSL
jgi:hypothetical protein